MELKDLKTRGSIGIGAVWAMLQSDSDRVFPIWFVRATEGEGEPKGAIVFRTVRYGAPARESDVVAVSKGRSGGGGRKKVSFDATGNLPVHYDGTSDFRTILISHLIVFDGYFVSL